MTMRPPPLPTFKAEETEPGVGLLALKQENARLRYARSEALSDSQPPALPALRASRLKLVGKWAVVGTALGLLAPLLEHYVPQYAAIIHELVRVLGPDAG